MKKYYIFCLLILNLTVAFTQNGSDPALSDYLFKQEIIKKYPSVDFNKDGDISIHEAGNYFPGNKMELSLNPNVISSINFEGIKYFGLKTLKIINTNHYAKKIRGYNLDLSKIGVIIGLPTTGRSLDELYLKGIQFSFLDFERAPTFRRIHLESCSQDMDISSIEKASFHDTEDASLFIHNTGRFANLKITSTNLKNLHITNTYIQGLDLTPPTNYISGIRFLKLSSLEDFETLKLPGTNSLKELIVNYTLLKNINLSKEKSLEVVHLSENKLIDIDITSLSKLTALDISFNKLDLKKLDTEKNISLEKLAVSFNKISSIDVSKNTKLKQLEVGTTTLTNLDVTQLPLLEFLDASENQLKSIDLSKSQKLSRVYLNKNSLSVLDLSKTQAEYIQVRENFLIALNVANGLNSNLDGNNEKHLNARNNPLLTCIIVDSGTDTSSYAWEKDDHTDFTIDDALSFTNTNVKTALLNTPKLDADNNGKISSCEAENFNGEINLADLDLYNNDIKELHRFKNITSLILRNNSINSWDFSQHKKLVTLDISNNNFSSININKNTALTSFYSNNNNLSSIDITTNTNLEFLWIENNQLTILDITKNNKISNLNCSKNKLTHLNTSKNNQLKVLNCSNNLIQWLDLVNNQRLEVLNCYNNPFTAAAVVDVELKLNANTELLQLNCSNTQITTLNISTLSKLELLIAKDNNFKKINIANTNNSALRLDISSNPKLKCVQVDDTVLNNIPNNWKYDTSVIFNTDDSCQPLSTDNYLLKKSFTISPNPSSDIIQIKNNSNLTIKNSILIGANGKTVLTTTKNKLNISHLKSGIYLLKIELNNHKKLTKKIIKE